LPKVVLGRGYYVETVFLETLSQLGDWNAMSKVTETERKTSDRSRSPFFKLLGHSAVRYLIVGGLSFVVDFGLLVLFHQVFGWAVSVATAVAFLSSLVFNFAVQRKVSFGAHHRTRVSIFRYALLVIANTVASVVVVELLTPTALGYMGGKVISTAAMTIWNFFLYRHWVFGAVPSTRSRDTHHNHEAS
jgi:putative flippase GtrA